VSVTRQGDSLSEDQVVKARIDRIHIDPLPSSFKPSTATPSRPIYSGHQAWLWHPGILIKDLVAKHWAQQQNTTANHLVVDQDQHATLRLQFPATQENAIQVQTISLGQERPDIPTGYQPPIDPSEMLTNLRALSEQWSQAQELFAQAIEQVGHVQTLAQQIAGITEKLADLLVPVSGLPRIYCSDLARQSEFASLVDQLIEQAPICVHLYNDEVLHHPEAGMRLLSISREWAELPLWACQWMQPRQPVFIDLSDSKRELVFSDGSAIDRSRWEILPRALTMTGYLRSTQALGFVHGLGGGQYDPITEAWWKRWQHQNLSPMIVATADLRFESHAPTAQTADLDRTVWYRHHLPHNLDRALHLESTELGQEKADILRHMHDDRDKARRKRAYLRLQQINETLRSQHQRAIADAHVALATTQQGIRNGDILHRRDWPFIFYSAESLKQLDLQVQQFIV